MTVTRPQFSEDGHKQWLCIRLAHVAETPHNTKAWVSTHSRYDGSDEHSLSGPWISFSDRHYFAPSLAHSPSCYQPHQGYASLFGFLWLICTAILVASYIFRALHMVETGMPLLSVVVHIGLFPRFMCCGYVVKKPVSICQWRLTVCHFWNCPWLFHAVRSLQTIALHSSYEPHSMNLSGQVKLNPSRIICITLIPYHIEWRPFHTYEFIRKSHFASASFTPVDMRRFHIQGWAQY